MTHYIYVPGLGDGFDPLRRLALLRWRIGTKVTFVPMTWDDHNRTYEQSYERIVQAIDAADGDEIVLVGESAGGAMALLAFSRQLDRVSRVVTICGYNHGAESVHPHHKRAHPAFYQLMPIVDGIVVKLPASARERITTIFSTRDHIVTPQHSRIQGASEKVLHSPGHLTTIARVLLSRIGVNNTL